MNIPQGVGNRTRSCDRKLSMFHTPILTGSAVEPEPPFSTGAGKKGSALAPAPVPALNYFLIFKKKNCITLFNNHVINQSFP